MSVMLYGDCVCVCVCVCVQTPFYESSLHTHPHFTFSHATPSHTTRPHSLFPRNGHTHTHTHTHSRTHTHTLTRTHTHTHTHTHTQEPSPFDMADDLQGHSSFNTLEKQNRRMSTPTPTTQASAPVMCDRPQVQCELSRVCNFISIATCNHSDYRPFLGE